MSLENNDSQATACHYPIDSIEYSVGFIRAYISPIIVLFGVIGNLFAFKLFLQQKPWNRFSIYVMTLAISDSLVLISNTFLDDFLGRGIYFLTDSTWMIKLDTVSLESCRLMELIGCWFVFNSGGLLVAFSMDRVACLCRPLTCRSNVGIGIAMIVCLGIILLGLFLSLPYALLQQLVVRQKKFIYELDRFKKHALPEECTWNSSCLFQMRGDNFTDVTTMTPIITTTPIVDQNTSISCALDRSHQSGASALLPFIFSTVLTYMVPCVLLVLTNSLILYKLIQIKTRRRKLCKFDATRQQIKSWSASERIKSTENEEDPNANSQPIFSALQKRRQSVSENRNELGRVVALLLLSCFYLSFTFPVSLALSIRASLDKSNSTCQHMFYAHLSRLLTSIKDVNYALNGYSYALFFQFYRQRILQILSCGRLKPVRVANQRTSLATVLQNESVRYEKYSSANKAGTPAEQVLERISRQTSASNVHK